MTGKDYITCVNEDCSKLFHHSCVNLSNVRSDTRKLWTCPVCTCAKRKGDNSFTPVRGDPNVTVRGDQNRKHKQASHAADSVPSESTALPLAELTEEIRLLRREVSAMKSEFAAFMAALGCCEERMDALSSKLMVYDTRLTATKASVEKIAVLEKSNLALQAQVNHVSQAMLRNDIEVFGLTETKNENPLHLFLTIAAVAGTKLSVTDVDHVGRVGPRRSAGEEPRPLVVRFCRRETRDNFYKTSKKRRLTTKDVNIEGPSKKIYINERLTPTNRTLFHESRREFKEADYKFCWTKGGAIYVKKKEGADIIIIRSLEDIWRTLGDGGSK